MSELTELTPEQKEKIREIEATINESQITSCGLIPTTSIPAPKLKPTVGRIVHYLPHPGEFDGNDSSPLPAIIVRVWSDVCVNLKVFTDGLYDIWKTSVYQKPDGVGNVSGFWEWPTKQ